MTKAGEGAFVAVVGPSGAGKDSLIGWAKRELAGEAAFSFPRRSITRPSDAHEDHDSIDELGFRRLAAAGGFALQWEAHGLRYGVPAGVHGDLAQGRCVVANVSRGVLPTLRARFRRTLVVLVTAPPEVIAARLAARGREQAEDQAQRLARAGKTELQVAADVEIRNDGALELAGVRFVDVLRQAAARGAALTEA